MPLGREFISKAQDVLEDLARRKAAPICYSDLAHHLDIAALAVGGVLQPINEMSYSARKVLLTSLVVSKQYHIPSGEFFEQAKRLGAMRDDVLPQEFWKQELQRVYEAYSEGNPTVGIEPRSQRR